MRKLRFIKFLLFTGIATLGFHSSNAQFLPIVSWNFDLANDNPTYLDPTHVSAATPANFGTSFNGLGSDLGPIGPAPQTSGGDRGRFLPAFSFMNALGFTSQSSFTASELAFSYDFSLPGGSVPVGAGFQFQINYTDLTQDSAFLPVATTIPSGTWERVQVDISSLIPAGSLGKTVASVNNVTLSNASGNDMIFDMPTWGLVTPIPEPKLLPLAAIAILAMVGYRMRQQKKLEAVKA